MRIGVYAGSFCPITKGHVDAIEKASRLVDKLYVVVGVNADKKYVIPDEVRLNTVSKAIAHIQCGGSFLERYDDAILRES